MNEFQEVICSYFNFTLTKIDQVNIVEHFNFLTKIIQNPDMQLDTLTYFRITDLIFNFEVADMPKSNYPEASNKLLELYQSLIAKMELFFQNNMTTITGWESKCRLGDCVEGIPTDLEFPEKTLCELTGYKYQIRPCFEELCSSKGDTILNSDEFDGCLGENSGIVRNSVWYDLFTKDTPSRPYKCTECNLQGCPQIGNNRCGYFHNKARCHLYNLIPSLDILRRKPDSSVLKCKVFGQRVKC